MNRLTAILLSLLLAASSAVADASARQGRAAEELTPAEEREARELACQFVERLRENNDLAPLVKDLFVKDLGARLRHTRDGIPMAFVAPEVAPRAGEDELVKFYVAEFNFFSRTLAHWMNLPDKDKDDDEECDEKCEMEKMYPPEVLHVLMDDPVFSGTLAREKAKQAAGKEPEQRAGDDAAADAASKPQPEEEEDDRFIKDLVTLRAATATSGKAAEALRAYAPEFSALRRAQEAHVPEEAFEDVHCPWLETTDEENSYGLPPGTRLIRINVEPAHDAQFALLLIGEDGRLRILLAEPLFGD